MPDGPLRKPLTERYVPFGKLAERERGYHPPGKRIGPEPTAEETGRAIAELKLNGYFRKARMLLP